MNAKQERKLLVVGLEGLLRKQNKIVDGYRALSEMLEKINIIHSLKQTAQKGSGDCTNGVEMERDTMLCWVEKLKMKEHAVVADCRSLKSQAWWENGDLLDALLDALAMDSEKHQRFLLAVEKTIENLIMSRPQ